MLEEKGQIDRGENELKNNFEIDTLATEIRNPLASRLKLKYESRYDCISEDTHAETELARDAGIRIRSYASIGRGRIYYLARTEPHVVRGARSTLVSERQKVPEPCNKYNIDSADKGDDRTGLTEVIPGVATPDSYEYIRSE